MSMMFLLAGKPNKVKIQRVRFNLLLTVCASVVIMSMPQYGHFKIAAFEIALSEPSKGTLLETNRSPGFTISSLDSTNLIRFVLSGDFITLIILLLIRPHNPSYVKTVFHEAKNQINQCIAEVIVFF